MRLRSIAVLAVLTAALQAQKFDVASIKPTTFPRPDGSGRLVLARTTGGPGTSDPGRIHYPYGNLRRLLLDAYQLKDLQLSGPDWMASATFDISATMPPSTTKEQFRVMLQNLLVDRFRIALHRENREVAAYSLVIAKGGMKLQEPKPILAQPDPPAPPADGPMVLTATKSGSDGFPPVSFPPGHSGIMAVRNPSGQARIVAQLETPQGLADLLSSLLEKPVADATSLTGKYDFVVSFSSGTSASPEATAAAADPWPDLFAALQSQLGLKLEPGKSTVQVLVIDHIEKTPTDN